jgi:DNA-binding NarL/FixJ family response regulator
VDRKGAQVVGTVSTQSSTRILIADDHAIFVEALRAYLEKRYCVVGVLQDGRAMVREALRLKPDLVIVDQAMPKLNGLDAAWRVRERCPQIRFVFLTMHDDPNLAAAALELGPIGFVLKYSGGSELSRAIDHVLRGQAYVTPKLRPADWAEAKQRSRLYKKEMTPRQRDVLKMLAEGRAMKEVAAILNLSEKTVEFHKHSIMQSFGFKSNADLVLFALQRGFIAPLLP